MKKQKLTFHFHDPNPAAMTADYIAKILVEANQPKIEEVLRKAAGSQIDCGKPAGIS